MARKPAKSSVRKGSVSPQGADPFLDTPEMVRAFEEAMEEAFAAPAPLKGIEAMYAQDDVYIDKINKVSEALRLDACWDANLRERSLLLDQIGKAAEELRDSVRDPGPTVAL